ncbi:MAG: hypothetical protein WC829_01745 [Hyphomicrobium sp.]|jgi:hypothetical protein
MIGNLLKAAVAVAVTPVALVVDFVTLPASADDPSRGPFDRTAKMLEAVGENVTEAIAKDQK